MDPLTSFVTIVSLLAAFESSSQGRKDIKEFKDWLNENNYGYMTAIIDNNESLQQDLASLMDQNHNQLMSQLSILNDHIISIASRMKGLDKIASSFNINKGLSNQAVDVLRQFVNSGSEHMEHVQFASDRYINQYLLQEGSIQYTEPRFIEEDINDLYDADLIDFASTTVYKITRQGVSFIEAIDNE